MNWLDKANSNFATARHLALGCARGGVAGIQAVTGAPQLAGLPSGCDPNSAANRAYYAVYCLTRHAAQEVRRISDSYLRSKRTDRSPGKTEKDDGPTEFGHAVMRDSGVLAELGFGDAFQRLMLALWQNRVAADYRAAPLPPPQVSGRLTEMDRVFQAEVARLRIAWGSR